jgi:diguanylate cyclase (GGDEF)-like protein/PAS domain S-box-containing protein
MRIQLGPLSRIKLGPVARISLGLVSLASCLLLTADLILGILPDEASVTRQIRKKSSEALAIQLTALAQSGDMETMRRTLHEVVTRDPDVLSIGVRRTGGHVVAETGSHDRYWTPPPQDKSTLTDVLVPIKTSSAVLWGQVEVAYRSNTPSTLLGWLKYPSVMLTAIMTTLGFLLFYLYLKRILQHLDPNAAIPDRVRTAFDALSEGVVVIDKQGQIVLANAGFRGLHPDAARELTGKKISDLAWLVNAIGNHPAAWPWERAMTSKASVTGETIKIERGDGTAVKVTINCAPVLDDGKSVRGCLITLDDLTLVEHMNQQLLDTVAQLEVAKHRIEAQNVELKHLADHDQLTGALTRRAFLERAQQLFLKGAAQPGGAVTCIMVDIDHFKAVNDRFGHLLGDQVIHRVALTLREATPTGDLVCRYGGEEFCMIVTGVQTQQAQQFAEQIRKLIEHTCGPAIIPGEAVRITASFGLASFDSGATTLAELIKQADQALFLAKTTGRNRVCRYDELASAQSSALAAA